MCEPTTMGDACGCAPKPAPKTRRTCETAGCSRVSGDARFCRTCRAEAPVRAELARKTRAHRDEVQAYRTERGEIVRFLASAGITGASPVHAAKVAAGRIQRDAELRRLAAADAVHDKSRLGTQTARANRMERDAADALGRLQAAHAERDELTAALQVAKDHERGQAERLRRAKAERDDWKHVAEKNAEEMGKSNMALVSLQSLYGGLGQRNKSLRLRLRIMYAVAGLLAVAVVVGGVL